MFQFLHLADARTLLWLNRWLAGHPSLYKLGLFLTDEGSDIATLLTFLLLWFWPEKKQKGGLLPPAHLPPRDEEMSSRGKVGVLTRGVQARSAQRNQVRQFMKSTTGREALTRLESRAQLLVFGVAGILAYVTARLLALQFDIDRPFATYLPVRGLPGSFEGLRSYGAFPSDHAALLGALPVALYFWDRRLARGWLALSVVLILTRIAVGFHYPKDMIVGAIIGATYALMLLLWYRREGKLHSAAQSMARGFNFSNAPYCYYLYILMALVGLEFAMHFKHVLEMVYALSGSLSQRF